MFFSELALIETLEMRSTKAMRLNAGLRYLAKDERGDEARCSVYHRRGGEKPMRAYAGSLYDKRARGEA